MQTTLFQDYANFVSLRQNAFKQKLRTPDYNDPVLAGNKFTNVQRVFDRVSQYQLKNVIYQGLQTPEELLLRIFVFNQFKTIAFWEYLQSQNYSIDINSFDPDELVQLVANYQGEQKLFTSAYVVPGKAGESKAKTIAHRAKQLITDLNLQSATLTEQKINDGRSLFNALIKLPGIGDFLGSQVVFDLLWHQSFRDFKPLYILGVGAKRGAAKLGLIPSAAKATESDSQYALETALNLINESEYNHATVNSVKVPLFVADVQNTFCETDKWFRKIHPQLTTSKSAPTTIKNKYKPGVKIDYQVPGWWVGKEGLVSIDGQ